MSKQNQAWGEIRAACSDTYWKDAFEIVSKIDGDQEGMYHYILTAARQQGELEEALALYFRQVSWNICRRCEGTCNVKCGRGCCFDPCPECMGYGVPVKDIIHVLTRINVSWDDLGFSPFS